MRGKGIHKLFGSRDMDYVPLFTTDVSSLTKPFLHRAWQEYLEYVRGRGILTMAVDIYL